MGVTVEENSLPIEEASVLVSGVYRSWIRFDVAVLREERNEIDFQYRGKSSAAIGRER